jgi:hypothetical protein
LVDHFHQSVISFKSIPSGINELGVITYHCFKSEAGVYGLDNHPQEASNSIGVAQASASHGNVLIYQIDVTWNSVGVDSVANFHEILEIVACPTSTSVIHSFMT